MELLYKNNTECIPYTVYHLAKQWRQGRAQKPATRVFKLQQNSPAFTSKFDQVQTHLEALASMDDLLSGRLFNHKLCMHMYIPILLPLH